MLILFVVLFLLASVGLSGRLTVGTAHSSGMRLTPRRRVIAYRRRALALLGGAVLSTVPPVVLTGGIWWTAQAVADAALALYLAALIRLAMRRAQPAPAPADRRLRLVPPSGWETDTAVQAPPWGA
jgi:hypothetical protein